MRRRNILWNAKTDELANRLAVERGFTHAEGGVSKFLEALVLEAGGKHVSGFKTQFAEIEQRLAQLEKTNRK
jgi:hypothetical protein